MGNIKSSLIISGLFSNLFMSKSYFVLFLSSMLVLVSCGHGKKEMQLAEKEELDSIFNEPLDTLQLFEEAEPPKTVDELFTDFFFTFANDTRFQTQRIRFPLRVEVDGEELRLSKNDWKVYNRFAQQDFFSVIYENEEDLALQQDTSISEVSVQWIYLQDGYVEKFNFKRIPQGQWVLFNIEKQDISDSPNGDFVQFYSEFVSDSVYQRSSLHVPVAFVSSNEGDDEEDMMDDEADMAKPKSEITADDWFEMQAELPIPKEVLVNIDYGQKCSESPVKNVLMEGTSNSLFMNFKFEKTGDHWKLMQIDY